MESGIMELHTERVPALAFVGECFAMFEVHAKSKGIRVVSEWGPAHPVPTSVAAAAALALRPCDEVVLDKFKLSQVLRNLMSNALKFTPPNGTVTVKAYFVADPTGGASAGPVTAGADGGGGGGTLAAIGRRLSHMATRRGSNMQSARILAAAAAAADAVAAADAPKEGSGSDKVADDPGVPGFLVVDVVDTGAGISLENQQKLFKEIVQFQPEKLQGRCPTSSSAPSPLPSRPCCVSRTDCSRPPLLAVSYTMVQRAAALGWVCGSRKASWTCTAGASACIPRARAAAAPSRCGCPCTWPGTAAVATVAATRGSNATARPRARRPVRRKRRLT